MYGFANGDPVSFSDPFGLCASDDIYYNQCGEEIDRIQNDLPDAHFLVTDDGRTLRLDGEPQGPITQIVDDPSALDAMAISLSNAAPNVSGIGEFKRESGEGGKLDLKHNLNRSMAGTLWNAGDGTYWQNDKVGNVAWAHYGRSRRGYPAFMLRAGAHYQSLSVYGVGDDRLDQVAIMRGAALAVSR